MAQDTLQQISQRLQDSEHILIAFPYVVDSKESGDALGSALALFGYLQKIGKKVDLAASGFETSGRMAFLPRISEVRSEIVRPQSYTLRVKNDQAQIKELSYGVQNGALEIYLTPESGELDMEHIELHKGKYKYDTVVTLDAPDFVSLGKIFEQHASLFYNIPIINIDHHSSNEHYGQINFVDINAASTGEIVAGLLQQIGSHYIDADIATNLFAAIFLKTHGFKNTTISPNALKIGAELIQLGARREEIMKNIFRSRSLACLRLWGKALAHLKSDPVLKFAWSTLTSREILESGGDARELPDVIEELIFTAPEAALVALIYEETQGRICVILSAKKQGALPTTLPWDIAQSAPGLIKYCLLNYDIMSAEREVVGRIKGMINLMPSV